MTKTTRAKYNFRSIEITPTKISCPKHGLQRTYLLYKDDPKDVTGVGCCQCFKDVETVKVTQTRLPRKVSISDAVKAWQAAEAWGTLPQPNPFGTTVSVVRHNQVIQEMKSVFINCLIDLKGRN